MPLFSTWESIFICYKNVQKIGEDKGVYLCIIMKNEKMSGTY